MESLRALGAKDPDDPDVAEADTGHLLQAVRVGGPVRDRLIAELHAVFSDPDAPERARRELETLAAGVKAVATWHATDTIQACREACGGAGYLKASRFAALKADTDVFTTFEGDNNVLLQLVAKRLLTDYSRKFAGADAGALAQFVAGQVGEAAMNRSGLRQFAQNVADFGSTARSVGFVRDTASQRQLLTDRVRTMVAELAGRLVGAGDPLRRQLVRLAGAQQAEV